MRKGSNNDTEAEPVSWQHERRLIRVVEEETSWGEINVRSSYTGTHVHTSVRDDASTKSTQIPRVPQFFPVVPTVTAEIRLWFPPLFPFFARLPTRSPKRRNKYSFSGHRCSSNHMTSANGKADPEPKTWRRGSSNFWSNYWIREVEGSSSSESQ